MGRELEVLISSGNARLFRLRQNQKRSPAKTTPATAPMAIPPMAPPDKEEEWLDVGTAEVLEAVEELGLVDELVVLVIVVEAQWVKVLLAYTCIFFCIVSRE